MALRLNGVATESDSFIQLFVSLTGSRALEEHAASACLIGDDDLPRGLGDLKIRYGDLFQLESSDEHGPIHRAQTC